MSREGATIKDVQVIGTGTWGGTSKTTESFEGGVDMTNGSGLGAGADGSMGAGSKGSMGVGFEGSIGAGSEGSIGAGSEGSE